jgi:transposase
LADKLDYESDLDTVVAAWAPTTAMAIKLKNRYTKEYNCWFTFLKALHIEPTNNESERALRTGVIFRKVTHCYRSNWGKDLHAYTLSVLETGRRCSIGALDAIRSVVDPLFLGPKIPEFLTA